MQRSHLCTGALYSWQKPWAVWNLWTSSTCTVWHC